MGTQYGCCYMTISRYLLFGYAAARFGLPVDGARRKKNDTAAFLATKRPMLDEGADVQMGRA